MERCDFCRQRIIWTVTSATGSSMPVDAEPADNGNVLLSSESHSSGRPLSGVLGPAQAAGARAAGQQLRLHHRLSCPYAAQWSRR